MAQRQTEGVGLRRPGWRAAGGNNVTLHPQPQAPSFLLLSDRRVTLLLKVERLPRGKATKGWAGGQTLLPRPGAC